MGLRINDIAPDFKTDSTAGPLSFHEWMGDRYAILFSHPKDFTPVCTTEFGAVARLAGEFEKRNTSLRTVLPGPCRQGFAATINTTCKMVRSP